MSECNIIYLKISVGALLHFNVFKRLIFPLIKVAHQLPQIPLSSGFSSYSTLGSCVWICVDADLFNDMLTGNVQRKTYWNFSASF